jgi:hypothetical protein
VALAKHAGSKHMNNLSLGGLTSPA